MDTSNTRRLVLIIDWHNMVMMNNCLLLLVIRLWLASWIEILLHWWGSIATTIWRIISIWLRRVLIIVLEGWLSARWYIILNTHCSDELLLCSGVWINFVKIFWVIIFFGLWNIIERINNIFVVLWKSIEFMNLWGV